ncbi:MAG: TolC family protein [Gemmatimonadetes bacterium]|uniref:TolC family protein n=1 Tax=Candidatus Kutchimonas denitrificans TaxID=3056748 RepID=A0AAE4ZBP4_9BACT|nr:TolC family protein [Gemmatimonadota bacterium]NIR76342.1 TolC family protein [Candidatus Kutchimonas denitrificans]NIS02365.1 TolC family protein [Gemmatimonadota bacterium]NIT68184.1 TolC family protein [Gemmatimonadota bacterium]NIU54408.1 TolC family protein [Gemmatimonadota bacterium]
MSVQTILSWRAGGLAAALGVLLCAGSSSAQVAGEPTYTLREAIQAALEGNRELENAQLGLLTADEQVREAWGSVLPSIDAEVGYTRNLRVQEAFLPAIIFDPEAPPDELVPVRFGADNAWSAQFYIRQPIFDAGAFVGVGTAGRFRALQEEVVRGEAQQTASRVRRAYYAALLAQEDVRLVGESIRRTEQTLRETEALNRSGLASSYDVLRLEVRLSNLRPNLQRAENALARAERELAIEMGLDQLTPIRVAGQLHEMNLASLEANEGANAQLLRLVGYRGAADASVEELIEQARETRSDLRQAHLDYQLQDARVRFERTSYYPKLNAIFNAGFVAQENGAPDFFGESRNQRSTTANVGLMLEIPIFQGFQRSARMQQRVLARQQSQVNEDLLKRQAANQIRTAYEALLEARARAQAQRQAVSQARRGFEIVTAQYLAGTSSQLEVTEGEVLLRESEFNYAQAVYDFLVAQTNLDEAVGVVPLVDVGVPDEPDLRISE